MPFPNGERHAIVKTSHQDIQFCIDENELLKLNQALKESQLMLEVHSALETK